MKIKSDTSVSDSFNLLLLREIKKINKWQKLAIKGKDPEGVHQLRISLRKMRTALFVFKPLISTKQTRQFNKTLRGFTRQFDNARDLDVYLLTNFADGATSLSELAIKQRKKTYQRVRSLLKGNKFNRSLKQWKKRLTTGRWKKQLEKKQRHFCKQAMFPFAITTLESQTQGITAIASQHHSLTNEELHQLRIKFKKLRYTAEFFCTLFEEESMLQFIHQIKQLQDNLGEIHDCFVVKTLHQQLLTTTSNATTEEANQLEQQRADVARDLRADLQRHYQSFCQLDVPWHNNPAEVLKIGL